MNFVIQFQLRGGVFRYAQNRSANDGSPFVYRLRDAKRFATVEKAETWLKRQRMHELTLHPSSLVENWRIATVQKFDSDAELLARRAVRHAGFTNSVTA